MFCPLNGPALSTAENLAKEHHAGQVPSESHSDPDVLGDPATVAAARLNTIRQFVSDIEVRFRTIATISLKDYPRDYSALLSAAETGDGTAAFLLSKLLQSCKGEPFGVSQAEFDSDISRVEQTHQFKMVIDGEETWIRIDDSDPENLSRMLKHMRRRYEACNDVPLSARESADEWLRTSIKHGAKYDALLSLGKRSDDKGVAREIFMKVWNDGDARALNELALLDANDYTVGTNTLGNVSSYAYLLASTTILARSVEEFGKVGLPSEIFEQLQHKSLALHEHEFIEAISMAKELIDENSNCCVVKLPRSN